MSKLRFNLRYFTVAAGIILCLFIFAACENPINNDPENPSGNTWVEFKNLEQSQVIIYSDPARQAVFAEVAANGTKKVPAEPTPMGMAFYPTFRLNYLIEYLTERSKIRITITIPYNGPPIIAAVEANKTNRIPVPKLASIEIDSAYIVLINQSNYSMLLMEGSAEKPPMNGGPTIINSGQNAVYKVFPGPVSNYSLLSNTTTPVAFPANLTEFKREIIYVLAYDGTSLTLADEVSVVYTIIPPAAPENVNTEAVSSDSVRITWDAVYDATSYRIYRATSAAGTYSSVGTSTSASHTDTSLPAGQVYYYKISAVNNKESEQSAAVFAIMPPDNVRVTAATINSVSLAWNAFNGASGYNVYRSDSEDGTYNKVNSNVITVNNFTDTDLLQDTTYWYKVSAIVSNDEGFPSIQISASTLIFTVTFNANGATSGTAPSAQTAGSGSSITLSSGSELSRTGYLFGGWNTNTSGTGTNYSAGSSYAVTGNVTLYAKWDFYAYEMVFVPGGSFRMGQNGDGNSGNVTPVRTVTLSGFYIGRYEVTQELYQSWDTNPSNFSGTNLPVERVTWFDAVEFANRLSERDGLQPVYTISNRSPATGYPITSATVTADWSKNGYRLPTEAQWEYAAKGGDGSPGNFMYAGSNYINIVGWYSDNSGNCTHAVGTKLPNGLGIYDMSGNVGEWCWDWYGSYPSTAETNPRGASSGTERVLRGGSWAPGMIRSVDRAWVNPSFRNHDVGFRLVRP